MSEYQMTCTEDKASGRGSKTSRWRTGPASSGVNKFDEMPGEFLPLRAS